MRYELRNLSTSFTNILLILLLSIPYLLSVVFLFLAIVPAEKLHDNCKLPDFAIRILVIYMFLVTLPWSLAMTTFDWYNELFEKTFLYERNSN